MKFIEINNNIINIEAIELIIYRKESEREKRTEIFTIDGGRLRCDDIYYTKLKELLKPTHLSDDKESVC